MSRSTPPALPDLDDAEFTAKLRPLGDMVIPKTGQADRRILDYPDIRNTDKSDKHTTGGVNTRKYDQTDLRKSRLSVAERLEHIEQVRGPKRRFEFLIPVRVGEALAMDAAGRGQSAATRLLEILRDAGYPVIPEDFVDLRKEKGRGGGQA